MQQKLVHKAGAFVNNVGKKPQKPHPKQKNNWITYLLTIFALPKIQCKWQFFQSKRLDLSHFEGSIIP